jgi:hypothetical protein
MKLLDFFVTYTDNDYSETDIAGLAGVSLRTAFREIPKFESVGLIAITRKVGGAKMCKLNPNSEAAKHLQQFAFDIATKRVDNTMKDLSHTVVLTTTIFLLLWLLLSFLY